MAAESTAVAVGVAGAGLAGMLVGFDADAGMGALCGALLFFISAEENPIRSRLVMFLISLLMGYKFAPVVATAQFDMLGMSVGPLNLPAPAAFVSAAFVVAATLTTLRLRSKRGE